MQPAHKITSVYISRRHWNLYRATKNFCVVATTAMVIATAAILLTAWFGGF